MPESQRDMERDWGYMARSCSFFFLVGTGPGGRGHQQGYFAEEAVRDLMNAICGANEPWERSRWERAGKKVEVSRLSACLPTCRDQISGDTVKTLGRIWQPQGTLQTAQGGAKSAPALNSAQA